MSELTCILDTVCVWLQELGVDAAAAYLPGETVHRTAPVVTVGLQAGTAMNCGLAGYLGEKYDSAADCTRELYAKRVELTLGLDIWSPRTGSGAETCLAVFGTMAAGVLRLPGGIRIREITCGETHFDSTVEMFVCPASMAATVYLYAEADGGGEFTDFYVKGVLV